MSAADDEVEIRAVVYGMVQGVGFRATARHLAAGMNLRGTARNLPNGCVEIIVQGTADRLRMFFQKLQNGTIGRIDSIEQTVCPVSQNYDSFSIIR